jgi:hypothetical protein
MVKHWHALGDDHIGHRKVLAVPSFEDLISDIGVKEYPYAKTWERSKRNPFGPATSGSTGIATLDSIQLIT